MNPNSDLKNKKNNENVMAANAESSTIKAVYAESSIVDAGYAESRISEYAARLKEEYGEKAKGNVSYSKIKADISAEESKEKNNNEGNTIDLQI